MQTKQDLIRRNHNFILAFALIALMYFQSTRQFIATIYYENLTGMGMSPSVGYLAVFLAPLLMVFLKELNVNMVMLVSGVAIILHRLYGSLHSEANLYMLFHAVVIIAFGTYFPSFLTIYYAFHAKHKMHTMPWAIIIGLVLAILTDITLCVLGDTLDITIVGITGISPESSLSPLWFTLLICAMALYCVCVNYLHILESLPSIRVTQRSGQPVSSFWPGICLGLLLSVFFILLGTPGTAIRWTEGSYNVVILSCVVCLTVMIMLLQWSLVRKLLFHPVSQVILNALQLLAIIDILWMDYGLYQFLAGIALSSLIMDMFILFQIVGTRNYSIIHFIRLTVVGIITFLVILFLSIATLVWAHVGPPGLFLKGQLIPLLTGASLVYITTSVFYNSRIYNDLQSRD
ncbi:MAG: hypothetical protein HQM11_12870 [SAR324 cluster bacterium]|nr:hypothetical protein [SAR324 cluster bacterium]